LKVKVVKMKLREGLQVLLEPELHIVEELRF
jgi:hypothetical protein